MMFYEGLHGLVVHDKINMAQYVDLGVGVVPIVNLEWIQKIQRDNKERGYSPEVIVDTILRRMPDYVNVITPQFSFTDINFQRVPTVDTSNPFIARDIPTPDESLVIIRFKRLEKWGIDFPWLLNMIPHSFMSRRNTIVVPGGKMGYAMELILTPIIHDMLAKRKSNRPYPALTGGEQPTRRLPACAPCPGRDRQALQHLIQPTTRDAPVLAMRD